MLVQVRDLVLEVVVLGVGLESLQEISLLSVPPPLVLNTGMGGVVALRWRGRTVHGFSFYGFGPLPVRDGWFPHSGYVVVFVEVALVGKMVWIVLTPLLRKCLGTGFTFLVLTPVLSFVHSRARI
jgi:hypothetical protein